jgi:hypothetical protein
MRDPVTPVPLRWYLMAIVNAVGDAALGITTRSVVAAPFVVPKPIAIGG